MTMKLPLLFALLVAVVLPPAAAAQPTACQSSGTYPEGAVFTLEGTSHIWLFEDGALRWAGDTRALAGIPVRWDRECTMNAEFLQGVRIVDPLLSLGLVKIGDPIYLAKWETTETAPRLLQIQSLADLAVFGITGDNYGRFVLERAAWEQRYNLNAGTLARAPLPAAVQTAQQVASPTQSGWATVVEVAETADLLVRNAQGTQFGVRHIGIIGPTRSQGDWRGRAIEQHRALIPPGTRVWLQRQEGLDNTSTGLALRHVSLGPGQQAVAEQLLRSGSVWVFPHSKHSRMWEYADAQATAVTTRTGAWADTKTSTVYKPRGATRGGLPIDPEVLPVLAALDAGRIGNETLLAVNAFPVEIGISQQRRGTLGSFSPRFYSIQLSTDLMAADPATVAGVLVHELTHVRNMIATFVEGAAIGCFDDENKAFEAAALYWAEIYPDGKPRSTHWLDRELNANLTQYRQGLLEARVREAYNHQCASE
jgi:endonuclease YncB( thermonuclease family)